MTVLLQVTKPWFQTHYGLKHTVSPETIEIEYEENLNSY